MKLHATGIYYQELNESIRRSDDPEVVIDGLCGQRYIACGAKDRSAEIVYHIGHHTCENDLHIGRRKADNIIRSRHHFKHWLSEHNTDNRDYRTAYHR